MTDLTLTPNFRDADGFYAALIERVEARGEDGALRLLGRLALILANQVGDPEALTAALALATAEAAADTELKERI